jgi:hypothetical protein
MKLVRPIIELRGGDLDGEKVTALFRNNAI